MIPATIHYEYVQPIVASAAERQSPLASAIPMSTGPDAPPVTIAYGRFTTHFAKLDRLGTDPSLWSEESEQPNSESLTWARMVLQRLFDLNVPPTRVVASAEGGAAVCFVDGDKYADIESLNSGEILGVLSDERDKPIAWEIEPSEIGISSAVERIREFIYAP